MTCKRHIPVLGPAGGGFTQARLTGVGEDFGKGLTVGPGQCIDQLLQDFCVADADEDVECVLDLEAAVGVDVREQN